MNLKERLAIPYYLKISIMHWPLIFALLFVVACSPAAAPTPTPTKTPSVGAQTHPTPTPQPSITQTPIPSPTATETVAFCPAQNRPPRMNSPEYGMQAFLWYRPETAWRDLDLIKNADFGWVRQMFAWTDIEGRDKGIYDWSRTDRIVRDATSRGINILASVFKTPTWLGLSYPDSGAANNWRDLADFLTAFARRYRGCIRAYSIWNEPNLSREWGGPPDPAGYTSMLKVAYQAIKNADPGVLVISAGLSPTGTYDATAMPDHIFLEQMYQAGAAPYFDVLGLHAPGYKAPPEISPEEAASNPEYGGQRFFAFRHVEDMRAIMVQHGDGDKQVAILELGWTSDQRPDSPYYWHAVSEEEKADYLVRAFAWAKAHWSAWMGVMTVIYIADPDWTANDEQYWWASTQPDGQPRPAYSALKEMTK